MALGTGHPLVVRYLRALAVEARELPPQQGADLLADIEEHLGLAVPANPTEAQVRNILDRLGTPSDLVQAAGAPVTPPAPVPAVRSGGAVIELAAITALLVAELGSFLGVLAVLVWVSGLVLLTVARQWSLPQKVLGVLGVGTGLPLAWLLLGVATTSEGCQSTDTAVAVLPPPGSREVVQTLGDCGAATMGWANYLVIAFTLAYLAFQGYLVWHLARAARSANGR